MNGPLPKDKNQRKAKQRKCLVLCVPFVFRTCYNIPLPSYNFPVSFSKKCQLYQDTTNEFCITFISLILSRKSPPLLACFTASKMSKSCLKSVSLTLFHFSFLNCFNMPMKIEFWFERCLGTTRPRNNFIICVLHIRISFI